MAESNKRAAMAQAVETGGGISSRGEMEVGTSPALRPSSSSSPKARSWGSSGPKSSSMVSRLRT